jgi:hypothetical protein
MKKRISKKIRALQLGDLVEIFWLDASKGEARIQKKSKAKTQFDIPVQSTGYFIGVAGQKTKHIILVRDSFQISADVYDIDWNCVPIGMIYEIKVALPNALNMQLATHLQKTFLEIEITKRRGRTRIHVKTT